MAAIDRNADLLFEYLGHVLYDPAKASLDIDALDEDFRELGEGLVYFGQSVTQMRAFAAALARGDLDTPPPPRENELASPLKGLQASLRHITWQTQQVAKGDYKQRVDFMGEFSAAFNTMIEQLDQRQKALEAEIASGHRKTLALEHSNSLLEAITAKIPQGIVVLDQETKSKLFTNGIAEAELFAGDDFARALLAWLEEQAGAQAEAPGQRTLEFMSPQNGQMRYLSTTCYPLHWRSHNAVAFVITDVSAERQHVQRLESVAYEDNLTRAHNRHYGMERLRRMLDAHKEFCICFADMDFLKYVNDTYGHAEGDNYIVTVVRHLRTFSESAVLCRLGGDEFMLLVEGLTRPAAERRMHEIREALMAAPCEGEHHYQRSISYGVVQVDADNTLDSSELLGIADERMYQYKRAHKKQRMAERL